MIRTACFTALCILACQGSALAHPPSAIDAKIAGTGVTVTVRHGVNDPTDHYIKYIKVTVNGTKAEERIFSAQTDGSRQLVPFDIPTLKPGDTVTVEAACSRAGELQKDFTVK